jgi:hypothetical protein
MTRVTQLLVYDSRVAWRNTSMVHELYTNPVEI